MDRLYISIGIIILSLLGIHVNKQMKKQQTEHFAGVISQLPKYLKQLLVSLLISLIYLWY